MVDSSLKRVPKRLRIEIRNCDWSSFEWTMKVGAKDFERGRPIPKTPRKADCTNPKFAYWMGYMLARAREWFKRRDVMDALRPDPDEPRPRKAA